MANGASMDPRRTVGRACLMNIERHARLKAIFAELAALPVGPERDARRDALCGGDLALRSEAERLLRFDSEDDQDTGAALRSNLVALWDLQGATLRCGDPSAPARYKIDRCLGEGGFGSVYLAREEEPIPRLVAIKVIKPGMDTREVLSRFDTERRALATMDHPGIARVFAAGAGEDGRPYFVMEYVEGAPITAFADEQQLSVRERLELFVAVCQAIQHAHYKGIVHRDIKPANVLVTRVDGRPAPKVIDFGIAKAISSDGQDASQLTRDGQLLGTPLSMSPEQAGGTVAEVDTRTDVYGLGGLIYELLSGQPPFTVAAGKTSQLELLQRVIYEDPLRPSQRLPRDPAALEILAFRRGTSTTSLGRELAEDLDWIVMKALAKQPAQRYSSANELASDIQRYLTLEPVLARPPSRSYQVAKFARRHRAGIVVATVMLALLLAGSIGTFIGWRRSIASAKLAQEHQATALENLGRARLAEEEARNQARRAEEESAVAREIEAFLSEDLLGSISPESQGYEVSMRRVLDNAANKIAGRLKDAPRVELAIRTTLGRTYRQLAVLSQAEEQIGAALELTKRIERTDPVVAFREAAGARHELGRLRLQQNRNAEAENIFRALLRDSIVALGEEAADSIDALHFLGVSLAEQGRFGEAAEAFDRSHSLALATVGEGHELTIQALHSQGVLRMTEAQALDRPPAAGTEQLLDAALTASRDLHGSDDPRSIRRMISLASYFGLMGQAERGRPLYEEAMERSARCQGPGHPTTAVAALGIGTSYMAAGSLDRASETFEQALEMVQPLGDEHPLVVQARYLLAVCLLQLDQLGDSERHALAAFEALEQAGEATPLTAVVAQLLAEICTRDGRPEEADDWRALADPPADR